LFNKAKTPKRTQTQTTADRKRCGLKCLPEKEQLLLLLLLVAQDNNKKIKEK
jgi:hypothetical protein